MDVDRQSARRDLHRPAAPAHRWRDRDAHAARTRPRARPEETGALPDPLTRRPRPELGSREHDGWIQRTTRVVHREVQMRARGHAGQPDITDDLAAGDVVASMHGRW